MSKRKGLSIDEKCDKLEEYLLRSGSFYTMKELEQICMSLKIPSQSTKDIVKALIQEKRVTNEKVGALSLFWAFEADKAQRERNEYQQLQLEVARLEKLEGATQSLQTSGLKRIKENCTQKACFLIEAQQINANLREELALLELVLNFVVKADLRGDEVVAQQLQKWQTEAALQQDLCFHSRQSLQSMLND